MKKWETGAVKAFKAILREAECGKALELVDQDGRKIAFTIHPDEMAECPTEWGNSGEFFSFSHRHSNFLDLHTSDWDEAVEILNGRYGHRWVQLGYFEHGRSIWFPAERGMPSGTEGDFRWDGCMRAGIWVMAEDDWKYLQHGRKDQRREKILKWADRACEDYTAWCNGDTYGYNLVVGEEEDGCCGFYGAAGIDMILEDVAETLLRKGVTYLREEAA